MMIQGHWVSKANTTTKVIKVKAEGLCASTPSGSVHRPVIGYGEDEEEAFNDFVKVLCNPNRQKSCDIIPYNFDRLSINGRHVKLVQTQLACGA